MPIYQCLGNVPPKRHIQHRDENGALYYERLLGLRGFDGRYSLTYHVFPPTEVSAVKTLVDNVLPKKAQNQELRHRHLKLKESKRYGDPVSGRRFLLTNDDITISICLPDKKMDYFFSNGNRDEVVFVHEGSGRLESTFGSLPYKKNDYIVIPKGTVYRFEEESPGRFLVLETPHNIEIPSRYINEYGQLRNQAPYYARDIHGPASLNTKREKGQFEIRVKTWTHLMSYTLTHHPFDVVGWDGYLYPFTFNIDDFEPITGKIHQPPPVHQTFAANNFVICSFVPRLFDYHPEAVPVPYFHSNLQSDEVLYYVNGNFMSRRGIEYGSITLHPAAIPHGPHPGTIEASLGKAKTDEVAVMVDTFKPLFATQESEEFDDSTYPLSWL